jgi:hypothetical protein
MFSLALLIAVGPAAALENPCTTAGPVVPVPPAPEPASPCAIPTTPPSTCATFACPANYFPKGGAIFCGNKGGPHCCKATCCNLVTTVTTTPLPTCESYTCPDGWNKNADSVVCAAGHCDTPTCCGATTVTTTPLPTCGDFTCPDGSKQTGAAVVCASGHCDTATCCKVLPPPCTTVKITTVTTTPAPTCDGYACPDGYSANAGSTVCGMGKCNTATCCAVILTTVTTTPAPNTCATFACPASYFPKGGVILCDNPGDPHCCKKTCCNFVPPPTPASPCAPVAPVPVPVPAPPAPPASPCETAAPTARKYDAKEAALVQQAAAPKKEGSMVPAWAFPFFGVVAMFSFAAFVAVRIRSNQRSTRQYQLVEPV